MKTPFFSPWRAQLAALGRRTTHRLRQVTLAQLGEHLAQLIPPHLLASQEEGLNSRQRIDSLRLSFECFVWQLLNPHTSCREVVRQVQALCRLQGQAPPHEGNSAYIQARQRLPKERFERVLKATALAADQRAGHVGHIWLAARSKSSMAAPFNCLTHRPIRRSIPSLPARSPAVAFG